VWSPSPIYRPAAAIAVDPIRLSDDDRPSLKRTQLGLGLGSARLGLLARTTEAEHRRVQRAEQLTQSGTSIRDTRS
jgi:hypothetical protein